MGWIAGVLINAILFVALAGYFPGLHVDSFLYAVIASLVLSVLNLIVRPVLVILTLPITMISLGLFLFVINAITLLMTDSIMGYAFEIESFGLALVIAIIMALVNMILQSTILRRK
ncbi:phage holin family protein [Domibacillus indicus]|uniref:phage holin family protein n=1 Tax=Domibacillus TaxID=1433999 RepID=UPI0020403409|nr:MULTISPECIES: phage holin family protein [Domibacillus]MCM3787371.1 phage holin family protein [Domibacillus indicus]WNS81349.1 phage holin family protein [Domibacillus sp. DTU_2020_1001157_1_SI_ALB_TIR_016]